jgi:uncharacterized protein YbjT (DUF2867 family)
VRDPTKLSTSAVRGVVADLTAPDQAVLESAVEGADAVLSGVGPRSKSEDGVASRGTRAIVQAMQAAGSRRIVVVSAALVGSVPSPGRPHPPKHDPGDGIFMRHLLGPMATAMQRKHMVDLAVMEDIVRDSSLDWTVIRPPPTVRQAADRHLSDGARTEPPARAARRARRRRPPHAAHDRATRVDRASDQRRRLDGRSRGPSPASRRASVVDE